MRSRKFKVRLSYFKASGKWYADGDCEVQAGEIVAGAGTPEEYSIAYTYDVIDAVALMDSHPGLNGRWTDGPILVSGPEISPSHLITDLQGLAAQAKRRTPSQRTAAPAPAPAPEPSPAEDEPWMVF